MPSTPSRRRTSDSAVRSASRARCLLALLAVTAIALFGMPALASAAAEGARVAGTVTRADSAAPVDGVDVQLIGDEASFETRTAADGTYAVDDVPDGEYRVRFAPPEGSDLAAAFWRDAVGWEQADVLTVSGGAPVQADMVLRPGATLAGTVTRASDGSPVEGVVVWIDGDTGATTAETGADGRYLAVGLTAGTYVVEFAPPIIDDQPPELAFEYWDGVRSPYLATPIEVAAGASVTGIDASLEATGSVSGRVTHSGTGEPLAGVEVSAIPELHTSWFRAVSAEDGTYTIAGIPPGRAWILFSSEGFLDVFWPDARNADSAELVTVEPATTTPGIDAELDPAASVSGIVTFEGSAWTSGGMVRVEPVDGDGETRSEPLGEDGSYRVGGLGPEAYAVSVEPRADEKRAARQFWSGAPTRAAADPVEVGSGAVVEGIDFDLVRGADIAGTVDAGDDPAEPVAVVAYRWNGADWDEAGRTHTWGEYSFADPPGDQEGSYLPAGIYAVGFEAEGLCTRFWDDAPSLADADRLELQAGATRDGIDAMLRPACPTPSPTPTPTPTPEPTPTVSPTPTPTVSPTPGPTPTASPTPTPMPEPTPTASPTPCPEPTPISTASPVPTSTISPVLAPTVSPAPDPVAAPVPRVSPSPRPTASSTPKPISSATPTAVPSPSPTLIAQMPQTGESFPWVGIIAGALLLSTGAGFAVWRGLRAGRGRS